MQKAMTISPIHAEEAFELANIHKLAFGDAAWSLEQITSSLNLSTTAAYAARCKGDIIGFILLQTTHDEAEILTFCVTSDWQGNKVGEQILLHAVESQMDKDVFLEVAADNQAACALYAKTRFVIIGRRQNYYKRGNGLVDALTFRRPRFASK